MVKARCFELVTEITHPKTGEQLIDISAIDNILKKHPQVISYGWIVHNKDTYTSEDEKKTPEHKEGSVKNSHVHIVMKFSRAQELSAIAKWFGVAENFIEKKNNGKGKRDAYLDCLTYLTHEDKDQQKAGKFLYDDSEVHFYSEDETSFREYLDREAKAVEERKQKYGNSLLRNRPMRVIEQKK